MPLEASCIQYSCRGSNPGPSACEADVMTNYTTRASLVCAPCEDRTHDLRIAGEPRATSCWVLDYETCALPTELKGREYTCRRTLGIEPSGEARMVLPCEKRIVCGEDGHRSHCLVHAKHALYHLSYIPERVCAGESHSSQKWRIGASIPLPAACKAAALPFELIPRVA